MPTIYPLSDLHLRYHSLKVCSQGHPGISSFYILNTFISQYLLVITVISLLLTGSHLSYANTDVQSEAKQTNIQYIHFLIPGSQGGGWDTTARETGKALLSTGLVERVYFENFIGAGGGRALIDLVNHPKKHANTLMVQSTPLLLRHLTGVIDLGYRDIIPISILIAEYQALVVPIDSQLNSVDDLIRAITISPVRNPILGGSSLGSLDHVTFALIAQAGNLPIAKLRYVPTDGGGDAMLQLSRGVGVALVSGIGEVMEAYRNKEIKILGVTSEHRLTNFPNVPTFKEQGFDVKFANWRGFFASSTISADRVYYFRNLLYELNQTTLWTKTRDDQAWQELFLQGDKMRLFLFEQEKMLNQALTNLGIE
ncbi:hypothetical protein Sps_01599 [Shewanella psychrophila]|uniref:Tripartite-type tricarboxylate transporter, receptor component TctC n=1 Tax=Shewanella psychrophila TaxID=225848 RepID=A0A1S6HMN1_9GAMM|nr:hypothetical protein Sps_01599 [Shewanella psychrophila]